MSNTSTTIAALILTSGLGSGVCAQDGYPTKPIRLIIPYAPGGGSDIVGRIIAEKLSEQLGRQVIPDNRAGGSTVIGAGLAASAPADGYTLLIATVTTLAVIPNVKSGLPYDYERDFAPVSMLATQPYVLVVYPGLPISNVSQLITYSKANPGKLNYGSPGVGSGGHIAAELLKSMSGIDMTHIGYKGSGPAVADILGGHIGLVISTILGVQQFVSDRRLRAVAISTARRSAAMPEVPTFAESGVPGYQAGSWNSLVVPGKTSPAIVSRLNAEIATALRSPAVQKRLIAQGADPEPGTPGQLDDHIKAERARFAKLLKAIGLKEL